MGLLLLLNYNIFMCLMIQTIQRNILSEFLVKDKRKGSRGKSLMRVLKYCEVVAVKR